MINPQEMKVENTNSKSPLVPTRACIWLMIFLVSCVDYLVRVNLSVSILGMIASSNTTEVLPDYGTRYEWSSSQQNLLITGVFYGSIATQILGGVINQMFGPRLVLGVSLAIAGAATALFPLATEFSSFWTAFFLRVLLGTASGILVAGIPQTIAKWAPPQEKGKFVFASIGGTLGTVFTWPLVAFLMTHFGWVYTFYIPAVIVLVVTILWFYIVTDSPAEHPWIREKELKFITDSQGNTVTFSRKPLPPLRYLLKSTPFWALLLITFGHLWSFYFLLSCFPKYLNEVLKFDIAHSGVLASAPYLSRFLGGFIFGWIVDYLIKHKTLSITAIRKVFCVISHILPGILLFSVRFVDNRIYCVVLITVALGMNGATVVVNQTNAFDLAPNYAGTISAIVHSVGTSAGIVGPMLVTYFTQEQNTVKEWNQVYLISSICYGVTAIFFLFYGSGEVQDWNDVTYKTKKDIKNKFCQPIEEQT